MEKIIRVLKTLDSLNLERTDSFGNHGWNCKDTDCFINNYMADYFDGVTPREFTLDDDDWEDAPNPYGYKMGKWGYNEWWFMDNYYKDWLSEEDFAL